MLQRVFLRHPFLRAVLASREPDTQTATAHTHTHTDGRTPTESRNPLEDHKRRRRASTPTERARRAVGRTHVWTHERTHGEDGQRDATGQAGEEGKETMLSHVRDVTRGYPLHARTSPLLPLASSVTVSSSLTLARSLHKAQTRRQPCQPRKNEENLPHPKEKKGPIQ